MNEGVFLDDAQSGLTPIVAPALGPAQAVARQINQAFEAAAVARVYNAWDQRRCARLGLLVGFGMPAEDIAADSSLAAHSANHVFRMCNRLGLSLRDARRNRFGFDYGADQAASLRAASAMRGISPDHLMRKIFATLCAEPSLIDAVLDDGGAV